MKKENIIKSYLHDIKNYSNNETRKNIHDDYNSMVAKQTMKYKNMYNFEVNPKKNHEFHNVEADAFKHTFGGAYFSLQKDNLRSLTMGIMHEFETPNNPKGEKTWIFGIISKDVELLIK